MSRLAGKLTHRNAPVDYFMLQEPQGDGPPVGTFAGRVIPERMTDTFGKHYRFAGIAPRLGNGTYDVEALQPGEWLVEPGLIYASEANRK